MGIFSRSKVTVKKEINGYEQQIFIDFFHVKNVEEYTGKLIQQLIGDNTGYLIIDTSLSYGKMNKNLDGDIHDFMYSLDSLGILYQKSELTTIAKESILGVSINLGKEKKVTHTIIGVVITPEIETKLPRLFQQFNLFLYVVKPGEDVNTVFGFYEENSKEQHVVNPEKKQKQMAYIEFQIFADNCFRRICITGDKNKTAILDNITNNL